MKNVVFVIICLGLISSIIFFLPSDKKKPVSPLPQTTESPTQAVPHQSRLVRKSLFVPYWSLAKGISEEQGFDQFIYFGISPTQRGINKEDAGYLQLQTFVQAMPQDAESILTLRMLDANTNFAILKDKDKQQSIITETLTVAKKYHFNGVLLDLEMSALPFDSLIKQVNMFVQAFSESAKKERVGFLMAVYGDTFYRIRPFEVKTLARYTDHMMIMAYDFSKAGGNPGPNFPLHGKSSYGYDYTKLVDNFSQAVPIEKLGVIFGLYGYDWTVDEKSIAQQIGKPRSLLEIQEQIVKKCALLQCQSHRDNETSETTVHYTDIEGNKHVVWYEDMESVRQKQAYLKSRGISSYSFWANSYF